MKHYMAKFERDLEDGGYVVTFPDFGYGVTQGESVAEADAMARDLLMLTIEDYMRAGKTLPAPQLRKGPRFRAVPLSALQAAKVDLYNAFLESELTKAEFARRTGIPKQQVGRLFSLRNRTQLNQIEAAFAALGKCLHIEVRNAA